VEAFTKISNEDIDLKKGQGYGWQAQSFGRAGMTVCSP
jgi:hypothetical protein